MREVDHVRIAILLPDLRAGGAERLHVELAREWLALGISVEFVLRQARGELIAALPAGATVVDLHAARVRNAVGPLARYLRERAPTALLAAMWPLTAVAPLAARMAGFGGVVAVSEHSPLSIAYAGRGRFHRWLLRASLSAAYPRANARIAVSNGVADDTARLSGMSSSTFTVINNPAASGRDVEGLSRPAALDGIKGPVVLTVGTLKKVKRHDRLVEAFSRLPHPGAVLCILGDGPERAALEHDIAVRGLGDRVRLPGFIADPAPWYAHADVFALTSDYEGFGNVLVEALEHGLPIVSTDCPVGPAEILDGGRYGRLVPIEDTSALAAALEAALASTPDRTVLKARARDFLASTIAIRYLTVLGLEAATCAISPASHSTS